MKKIASVFFLVVYLVVRPCSADEEKLGPKLIFQDMGYVLSAPVHWHREGWTIFSIAAASVAGTMAFADKPIFENIQRQRDGTKVNAFSFIEPFGMQYAYGIIGGFYLVGTLGDNRTARIVGRDAAITSLISFGLVTGIKYATGRSRPSRKISAFDFHPFSGTNRAFPSGHSTEAFGLATVIASHYHPTWLKITAYSLAGLVALSRIDHNNHFVSDVVAGAALGTSIGYGVVHFNRREDAEEEGHKTQMFLLPLLDRYEKGISLSILF